MKNFFFGLFKLFKNTGMAILGFCAICFAPVVILGAPYIMGKEDGLKESQKACEVKNEQRTN